MEIKDYLFYLIAVIAFPVSLHQAYKLFDNVGYIKAEKPECTTSNPYFY